MIVNLTPNGCLSFRHWLGEFEFLEFVWSEWKIPCDFIINISLLKKKKAKQSSIRMLLKLKNAVLLEARI